MRFQMNDLRRAMALRVETMTQGLQLRPPADAAGSGMEGSLFGRLVAAADAEALSRAAMVLDAAGRLDLPLDLVLNRIETGQLRSQRFARLLTSSDLDLRTALKVKRTELGILVNGIRDTLDAEPRGLQGEPSAEVLDGLAGVLAAAIPGAAQVLAEPEPARVLEVAF